VLLTLGNLNVVVRARWVNELTARNGHEDGTYVSLDGSAGESHILLRQFRELLRGCRKRGGLACHLARAPGEKRGNECERKRSERH
jgi:hypothetical protein